MVAFALAVAQLIDDGEMRNLNAGPTDIENSRPDQIPSVPAIDCAEEVKAHEDAEEGGCDKQRAEIVPGITHAAGELDLVGEVAHDRCRNTICNLARQKTEGSDTLVNSCDIDEVVREVDEPHARAQVVRKVSD